MGYQSSEKLPDGQLAGDSGRLLLSAGRVAVLFVKMNGIFLLSKKTQGSVFRQATFSLVNKTWYSVLDGFPSVSEGKTLKKSREGGKRRKGKTRAVQRPWEGCCSVGVLGCPTWSSAFTLPTCIMEEMCLGHMLPGPSLSEK